MFFRLLTLSAVLLGAAAPALWLGVCAPAARAQDTPTSPPPATVPTTPPAATPVDPRVPLETGFTPDPLVRRGTTRGTRPLRELAPGCTGFVGDTPDHEVRLETRFGFLRFFVLSPVDVTLALRGTDGRIRCVARPGRGPTIEDSFDPGMVQVWVGGATAGQQTAYELHVTEFGSVSAETGRGEEIGVIDARELGLAVDAETGRFRDRRLRRGFLPDPRQDDGRAGGTIEAAPLGASCRGFVASEPSHVLTLRTDFDYFRVQLGGAGESTTLMIRTPGGRYLCSAPEEGSAFIEENAWGAGRYAIWIGSREANADLAYRICYSEVRPAEGAIPCAAALIDPDDEESTPDDEGPAAQPSPPGPRPLATERR